ncbi:MAG: TIGR04222 domain-containing membrane protein [Sandaracinus sp.]
MPLYDLFPWNISSPAAYLSFYALLAIGALLALRAYTRAVLEPVPPPASLERPKGEGPYRISRRGRARTLPQALELAELRAGTSGVRDAILAALAASGVLRAEKNGLVLSDVASEDPEVRPLQESLLARDARRDRSVVDAATSIARELGPTLRESLTRAGLHPTKAQRARAWRAGLAVGAALAFVGLVRITRGLSLDHPVTFAMIETLVAAALALAVGAHVPRSRAGTRHLEGLAVDALPAAVRARSSARVSMIDAALASAILGVTAGHAATSVAQAASAVLHQGSGDGGCGGGGCGGCGSGCGG